MIEQTEWIGIDHPPEFVLGASALRAAVHAFLTARGYSEVMLPSGWRRAEEYGVEELRTTHSAAVGTPLSLLQSPELPVHTALVGGLDRWYSFARCWRFEADPATAHDGQHLLEFEQLIVGGIGFALDDMIALCNTLLVALAETVGIDLREGDFVVLRPEHTGSVDGESRDGFLVGEAAVFVVPHNWGQHAREVLIGRLGDLDATVLTVSDQGEIGEGLAAVREPDCRRLMMHVRPENLGALLRTLDVAGSLADDPDGAGREIARHWAPTWRTEPPLRWLDDETTDSGLSVRSFTAARVNTTDVVRIRDAELMLGGVDVAHIGELAGKEDLVANLREAGLPAGRFDYLVSAAEDAPPIMGEVSFGWERLCAVLLGAPSAAAIQLFPRAGDGSPAGDRTPPVDG